MSHIFDISIVIVNYNVRHFVVECLESFRRSNYDDLSVEVILVDNASIDSSVEVISKSYPEVTLIANTDNVGFSKANNQAIKIAKGKYILLLNPDTVLEEDTLLTCYRYMEEHNQVGALGVRMIDGAGAFLPESKRALPTAWNSLTKLVGLSSLFPQSSVFNGYALGHLSEHEQHSIAVLCGAFMFIPAAVLDKVGLLDERFFMYGEDIDLSYRILRGGYEVHYIPDTTIIHYKGESTKKGSLNYVKTFYNAMGLYVDKHYTGSGGAIFGRFLKLGIWVRASISAAKRVVVYLLPLLLDFLLICTGLFGFSQLWSRFYFGDAGYYVGSSLSWNIALYASIWILVGWLIGYYKKSSWGKRLQTVLIGVVAVLGIYGLLDESYRTSRVIILAGILISWLSLTASTLIRKGRRSVDRKKNVLIVAEIRQADIIKEQLAQTELDIEIVGHVYPRETDYDSSLYVNNISRLDQLTRVLKVDEVIFSTQDMSTKDIMKTMMLLDSQLSFKIAGDESLHILGSRSKNTSGEIYDIDLHYNLNTEYHRHTKRVLDVLLAIASLVFFPFTILANRLNVPQWARKILGTLTGKMTWVGYGDSEKNLNLPILRQAVYPVENNRDYARNYTVWLDLEVLARSWRKK